MEILYTDADVVVAVKPRGVISEAGEGSMPALLAPLVGTVLPVHRLDRGVGGVMVYARHKRAAARLCEAVRTGALKKTYTAVVTGVPEPPTAELRHHLFHDVRQNKSFPVDRARKGAKEAILRYAVTDTREWQGQTLCRLCVELETGRTHQIRVQLAAVGCPLVGDGKYGSRIKAAYPALTATGLTFPHPKNGRMLTFSAPVPEDFPWSAFGDSHYEIERKLLIAYPDPAVLAAQEGCRIKRLEQVYLTAPEGVTERVRTVREGNAVRYIHTTKRRVNDLRAVEEERELTRAELDALLMRADPCRRPVCKTRYCLPYGGHLLEIDLYDFWQDRATLEAELAAEDEAVSLPSYIKVLRDVTGDAAYKNVNLARDLPTEQGE